MNTRIKDIAIEVIVKHPASEEWVFTDSELEKFAELVAEDIDSEAVRLIQFIANDYYELSHDKIKWQRDDHMNRCRKFLDNYFENNNEQ